MKQTILVVEDEYQILTNIQDILDLEKFHTITADNGLLGVDYAKKYRPDLIICDVGLPGLNGFQVLAQLRQDPVTATIPLIFLTAQADRASMRHGMELGADDYLSKPFTRKELLQAISIRLEKRMRAEQQFRERLNDLCSNIAHSLPHELRTPLNGILGSVSFLLDSDLSLDDDEVVEMLNMIQASGHRLHHLIKNFLLYTELEMIAMQPDRARMLLNGTQLISTAPIIQQSAEQCALRADRSSDLMLNLCTCSLSISETHLEKVMTEIVENAFKFSQPSSPVQVTSHRHEQFLNISVADSGRGMSAEQLSILGGWMQFERKLYEQQGMGLGLAIAKRLIELHNGKLMVESEAGRHTRVTVVLPISTDEVGLENSAQRLEKA